MTFIHHQQLFNHLYEDKKRANKCVITCSRAPGYGSNAEPGMHFSRPFMIFTSSYLKMLSRAYALNLQALCSIEFTKPQWYHELFVTFKINASATNVANELYK